MEKQHKGKERPKPEHPQIFAFIDDYILPLMVPNRRVPITIQLFKDSISLFIGPREISWDRKTGNFEGCSTVFDADWVKGMHGHLRRRAKGR